MFQGVSRWLSNSVHLCVDVSIGQCTRYNFSKKIAQIFPHMCHAFCLRDFLLNMNVKKKKKKGYYESSNSGFANECQCDESVN